MAVDTLMLLLNQNKLRQPRALNQKAAQWT